MPIKITSLILTILFCVPIVHASAGGENSADASSLSGCLSFHSDERLTSLADRNMDLIIHLLNESGVDISYGDDGETIFSMIDSSLTRIILSLSSGHMEGFMEIPLIRETLVYFGISADEIVISPNESSGQMDPIEAYLSKI